MTSTQTHNTAQTHTQLLGIATNVVNGTNANNVTAGANNANDTNITP